METWLTAPLDVLLKTAASAIIIMVVLLLVIRLYGLRSFAKMSSVDFASTIAIGSVLASVTLSTDVSLVKGTVAIFFIIGFQQAFSFLKRSSDTVEELMENSPKYLMKGSEIIEDNMKTSGLTHADLMAKLREANVTQFSQIKAVVFETTGDVSVLHGKDDTPIEDEIMDGVILDFPTGSVFK